jgi:hypothetical protein
VTTRTIRRLISASVIAASGVFFAAGAAATALRGLLVRDRPDGRALHGPPLVALTVRRSATELRTVCSCVTGRRVERCTLLRSSPSP